MELLRSLYNFALDYRLNPWFSTLDAGGAIHVSKKGRFEGLKVADLVITAAPLPPSRTGKSLFPIPGFDSLSYCPGLEWDKGGWIDNEKRRLSYLEAVRNLAVENAHARLFARMLENPADMAELRSRVLQLDKEHDKYNFVVVVDETYLCQSDGYDQWYQAHVVGYATGKNTARKRCVVSGLPDVFSAQSVPKITINGKSGSMYTNNMNCCTSFGLKGGHGCPVGYGTLALANRALAEMANDRKKFVPISPLSNGMVFIYADDIGADNGDVMSSLNGAGQEQAAVMQMIGQSPSTITSPLSRPLPWLAGCTLNVLSLVLPKKGAFIVEKFVQTPMLKARKCVADWLEDQSILLPVRQFASKKTVFQAGSRSRPVGLLKMSSTLFHKRGKKAKKGARQTHAQEQAWKELFDMALFGKPPSERLVSSIMLETRRLIGLSDSTLSAITAEFAIMRSVCVRRFWQSFKGGTQVQNETPCYQAGRAVAIAERMHYRIFKKSHGGRWKDTLNMLHNDFGQGVSALHEWAKYLKERALENERYLLPDLDRLIGAMNVAAKQRGTIALAERVLIHQGYFEEYALIRAEDQARFKERKKREDAKAKAEQARVEQTGTLTVSRPVEAETSK